MDTAYDHIHEEALAPEKQEHGGQKKPEPPTLNDDFQEAYKAISSTAWGARLGSFFGTVVKQGESVYKEAQQELTSAGEDAAKGLIDLRSSLVSRTRSLSLAQKTPDAAEGSSSAEGEKSGPAAPGEGSESEKGVLETLRIEAAKRLKDIQKAEDAADEALLKFGTNLRNFLKDAVTIAPPATATDDAAGAGPGADGSSTVLFESKDAQGKRVFHTTRFDAQLHVIHSTLDSFLKDPTGSEYAAWASTFDVAAKTDDIARDLDKYDELRAAMEKVVPDRASYGEFWKRYYFLRHSIETAEALRRDLLKGAAATNEEEVGWDEDSDDESPKAAKAKAAAASSGRRASVESSNTIQPPSKPAAAADNNIINNTNNNDNNLLKPMVEKRKSHDEKSQADSDGSYDVVGVASGVPSHAPSSPKESRKGDDSEEEDWE